MADQLFMHHKPSKLRLLIMAAGAALMFIVCSLLFVDRASAHGWIENSRSDLCYDGINTGCGAVMYEPWSIEGRGDFPEIGVPDGQIAGGSKYPELDVQTENRWNKINMKGGPFTFHWDMVANHSTNYWDYYITKKGWDPNSPLKRSDLELFCRYEDNGAIPPMVVEHDCFIPNDRTGYYVIVGVWDIFDTVNAFYQVIDVNLTTDPSQPTTPAPGHPGDPNRFGDIRDWSPIRPYNPGEQVVYKGSIWQARWWTQGQEPGVHEVWQQIGPATGNPTAPAAPTGLTATAGNAQINLTWAPSSGATSYTVKRATTSGGPYTDVATGLTTPSYTNTGLTNGTTYYYVVSASNSAGHSPNSAQVSATPMAGTEVPAAPAAPAGLTATAGNAQVSLSWNAVSGATSYTVKRATTSGGPYTNVATGLTTPSYTNTGLTNDTTYYYVVSASNSAGHSPDSAPVSATPAGDPIASNLVLQYKAGDTNATDNQIKPHFNIKNNGTSAVDLSTLKIRYYFTKEGSAAMNGSIDWAQLGASNLQISFGNHTGTDSDTYVELGFSSGAGSIAAGGQSGEIQLRMSKADWSNFNEENDYSFDGTKTAFADWSRVVLYQNGTAVWGNEP
ncbi:lytic polysaccharide monooxygenase [Paenibacillus woosongensis]|uniref:lytic polysaccharide monooxygenase n=1 Tax=Paenibacillus woosongensis TaxID=307580 RepID=UPI001E43F413|nr:lytic polysaccharide monooxygenase [Paenibacillus woosongensis]